MVLFRPSPTIPLSPHPLFFIPGKTGLVLRESLLTTALYQSVQDIVLVHLSPLLRCTVPLPFCLVLSSVCIRCVSCYHFLFFSFSFWCVCVCVCCALTFSVRCIRSIPCSNSFFFHLIVCVFYYVLYFYSSFKGNKKENFPKLGTSQLLTKV